MATSKKKYNFKGLDDIFGESVADIVNVIEKDKKVANLNKVMIDVNLLQSNPHQPRKTFENEDLKELADSIKTYGIIQPIIVNKKNEIIAGERRTRAAKLANLKEVPVIVFDVDDLQMEEFAIIENIQRVDLLDIEEAIAYKKLSVSLKLTQEEIASRVGKSRSHIANIMRLLNLPQIVQDAMMEKKLSMGQAKPLLTVAHDANLLNEIFQKILEKDLTVREVEALIKNKDKSKVILEKTKKPSEVYMENKIMRKLGTKVTIEGGKFIVRYADDEDLNRIFEILGLIDED